MNYRDTDAAATSDTSSLTAVADTATATAAVSPTPPAHAAPSSTDKAFDDDELNRDSIDDEARVAREQMEAMMRERLAREDAEREAIRNEANRAVDAIVADEKAADPQEEAKRTTSRKRIFPVIAIAVVVTLLVGSVVYFMAKGLFRRQAVAVNSVDPRRSHDQITADRRTADESTQRMLENARQTTANSAAQNPSSSLSAGNSNAPAFAGGAASTVTNAPIPDGTAATRHAPHATNASGTIAAADDVSYTGSSEATSVNDAARTTAHPQNHPAQTSSSPGEIVAPLPSSSASSQEPFMYAPVGGNEVRGQPTSPARFADYRQPPSAVSQINRATPTAPIAPPFGVMLPVRTLGALYSLRSQGMVRMELARDVRGDGWSLRRGTILIGQLQAAELDRAFVRVTGYLDARRNTLVSFGGVVKGMDGADGFKGRRRTVGSAWGRVLGSIAERSTNVAQSWLAGRGGGMTIITGAAQPSLGELGGITTSTGRDGAGGRRDFVEVAAGTTGYVMVSDLPDAVEGEPPLAMDEPMPAVNQAVNQAVGQSPNQVLTEAEIAHLLTDGTPAEIRASLPRMSPAMRELAREVLRIAN